MLYSRYETVELKDEKGKVIGHQRVKKDPKKIMADEMPKHKKLEQSKEEIKEEVKPEEKQAKKKQSKKAE